MSDPDLKQQRVEALAEANDRRATRTKWRKTLAALDRKTAYVEMADGLTGYLGVAVESYRIQEYLRAAKGVGAVQSLEICRRAMIGETRLTKRVRNLTRGERLRLAAELMRRAG